MEETTKAAGIIVEFNPLHNGHAKHIRQTRRLTGREAVVAVMSGNFVQRGEPALIDKWRRTEMALRAGVDVVIELPLAYVLGGADTFARGAVRLLADTGVVDCLSFGSECGDVAAITRGAHVLATEPRVYKEALRAALDAGRSFAAARGAGLAAALGGAALSELLTLPNNGLGMEYGKALALMDSSMEMFTTHRKPGGPSATALRRAAEVLRSTDNLPCHPFAQNMPGYALAILREAREAEGCVFPDDFSDMFRYLVCRSATPLEEGLHHRFRKLTHTHTSLKALLAAAKTKRYTLTRLQRAAMRIVLDVAPPLGDPPYIRVLGFRKQAAALVGEITRRARLPVYIHGAEIKNPPPMLEKEWEAGDIYRLKNANPLHERKQQLVRI